MNGVWHPALDPKVAVVALWALLSAASPQIADAANAKFTAVVGGVTYQSGSKAAWQGAKPGTELASGARIRTDRRGKCEIKFPGGSLVRMPPRADLSIASVASNHVKLLSGQVLTNAVKGSGVRIEGATATASVQGTWVLFSGEDMSVWDGTATLETPLGRQQVGDQQRAGIVSSVAPLVTETGEECGEVQVGVGDGELSVTFGTVPPWTLQLTAVSVGGAVPDRFDPETASSSHPGLASTTDGHLLPLEGLPTGDEGPLYVVAYAVLNGADPAEPTVAAWAAGEPIAAGGMAFAYFPTTADWTYPWEFPTGTDRPWWYGIQPGVATVATPGTDIGVEMRGRNLSSQDALQRGMFAVPTRGSLGVGVRSEAVAAAPAGSSPGGIPLIWALGGAAQTEPQGAARLGKRFFGPRTQCDLYGLLFSGGSLAGARGRMAAVYDPVYLELGAELIAQSDQRLRGELSEAFAVWRTGRLDLTVGRQHYLEGPVNNGPLGAQFGYLTFDGVRAHYQGQGFALDGVWLEGYDRSLVSPGEGGGWLGRVSAPVLGGQVGLNLLKERGADTGLSLDFSLPAVPHYLDVYGEFGADPWDRHFQTWGLYVPWLFEQTGVDLFVEHAGRGDYPETLSAMAYKDLADDWLAMAAYRHVRGEDCELSVGLAWRFGSLAP